MAINNARCELDVITSIRHSFAAAFSRPWDVLRAHVCVTTLIWPSNCVVRVKKGERERERENAYFVWGWN
jgi:hypothetical protein